MGQIPEQDHVSITPIKVIKDISTVISSEIQNEESDE